MKRFVMLFLIAAALQSSGAGAQITPLSYPASAVSEMASSARANSAAVAPASTASMPASSASESSPTKFDLFLDYAEKVLKVLAYLVGGTWVYFNYFKGRTHQPRLEVKVALLKINDQKPGLLRVVAQAKNVGLSKVELSEKGTAVLIQGHDASSAVMDWKHLHAYPIFTERHHWIEPGVTIEDQLLVSVDATTYDAFRAELSLNSASGKITWNVISIA